MDPIVYLAALKSSVEKSVSAELLGLSKQLKCSLCQKDVLVVRKTFGDIERLAERNGTRVVIACPNCEDQATEDTEDLALVALPDPEIRKLAQRDQAERN